MRNCFDVFAPNLMYNFSVIKEARVHHVEGYTVTLGGGLGHNLTVHCDDAWMVVVVVRVVDDGG